MFTDRTDAGRELGRAVQSWLAAHPEVDRGDVVVLGLPRGGVPVAAQVAEMLDVPLDVIVVRKLGVPQQPELAMGAVGEGGARYLDQAMLDRAGVRPDQLNLIESREQTIVQARVADLRRVRPAVELTGRTVLLVDDGLATGSTAVAAAQVAHARGARRVVLAVPVAPARTLDLLRGQAEIDAVVCPHTPEAFLAVGAYYRDFTATTDDEVRTLLRRR